EREFISCNKMEITSSFLSRLPKETTLPPTTRAGVVGVAFHAFEWLFFRLAPIILIDAIVGIFLTRKKV
ncbi:MAG: hypothetical protein RSB97_02280, partial [Christensenella sp.]